MHSDDDQYKYDVAFSFLEQDESVAIQIDDLLRDRLSTFIYTSKQREIAGTDGEKTLNEIFGSQSRIVVVLYRETWGVTSWTRIEETAIRNRAFNEGYDFVLFIPMETPQKVPQWLPKTQIWIGLERWGIDGAASVIEAKVQTSGGTPKEETAIEFAKRKERDLERIKARKTFLRSENGVQAAFKEVSDLFSKLLTLCDEIAKETGWEIEKYQPKPENALLIYSCGVTLSFGWRCKYTNILENSCLRISTWQGKIGWSNTFDIDEPVMLEEFVFAFDTHDTIQYGWKKLDSSEPLLSSKQLAEFSIKSFVNTIHKQETGEEDDDNEGGEREYE
jgi:hypothetical protein